MLIYQQLAQAARQDPNRPAIRYLGKELRFGDLVKKVAQLSYLYQAELGPKARVALLASNSPAIPLSFVAFTNTRTPTIPLSPAWTFEELGHHIRKTGITHLGVSSDRVALARELLRAERLSVPLVEIERKQGGEYDGSFAAPPENTPKEIDPVLLLRTAGTLSEPRFASFDHKSLSHAAVALRAGYRPAPTDRVLSPLNWSHPFAWMHGMLFPLLTGTTCVIDEGLEGPDFLRFLTENAVTHLMTDAASAQSLLSQCAALGRQLPRLKAVVIGPGATPGAIHELKTAAAPLELAVAATYGQTESLWAATLDEIGPKAPEGSGRLLAGVKAKILDENGDEIERKGKTRVGRLAVSGPMIMNKYQGQSKEENEKATRMAIRGTWLYTGDVAELSGDGESLRVKWIGRHEELLERKAGDGDSDPFVSAEPIDAAARSIPGIDDVAGFVFKDARGKRVLGCAAVKPEGSTVREEMVLARCRSALPPTRAPECAFFVDRIPRAAIGRTVNRFRLAQQFNGISVEHHKPTPLGDLTAATAEPPADLKAKYALCSLADIHIGIPLPVTIHAFYKDKMIPFRPKGSEIDRETYDRLELKRFGTLYVQSEDLAALQEWSRTAGPSDAPAPASGAIGAPGAATGGAPPSDPALAAARKDAHRELLAMFAARDGDDLARRAIEINRNLLKEITKAGFTVRPLADLMAYSKGTAEHSVNVSVLAVYLALHLGYAHELILQHVGMGGLLHDFGRTKIDLRDDDSPEERQRKIELHPIAGAEALSDPQIPRQVRMIVLDHHEHVDGTGYPRKLKSSQIYDPAGIIAIADVFEKLASRAHGDMRTRYERAMHKLEGEYTGKLEPFKLEKSLRILQLSLG